MYRSSRKSRAGVIPLLLLACVMEIPSQSSASEADCGPLDTENQYGPFDYRDRPLLESEFSIVERFHFTSDVQMLIRGSTGAVGGDLDYTLRAIPNHHIALRTMVRYYTEDVQPPRPPMRYSAACYFDRAARLAPDDAVVWLLHGMFAFEQGNTDEASKHFERADALAPTDPEVQYNLGLMYLRLDRPNEALKHAELAYRGGYPLPGLRQKLEALGIWTQTAE